MVQLDARASISIFQLVFFTPALVAATLLCLKHGFGRSSGWFFLLTVSLCRIAGAATQLATYSNPSEGLFTASAILGSFGLSTLLLASLGFLSRTADSINQNVNTTFNPRVFRLVQLITAVGLILSIVGDTNINLNEQTHTLTVPIETKVGIIILLAAWILVVLITAKVIQLGSHIAQAERPLAWAVLVCLPFLLIRLIYAILSVFLNDSNFSLIFPSTVVVWTLSIIEECFVVFIYLLLGFKVPKLAAEELGQILSQGKNVQAGVDLQRDPPAYAAQPRSYDEPRRGQWRGSIILTLIGLVSDLFASRKRGPERQEMHGMPQQPTSMA